MSAHESDSVLLAKTWMANESGLLWSRDWGRNHAGYYSLLVAPGVFMEPRYFASEHLFWKSFEDERAFAEGRRLEYADASL